MNRYFIILILLLAISGCGAFVGGVAGGNAAATANLKSRNTMLYYEYPVSCNWLEVGLEDSISKSQELKANCDFVSTICQEVSDKIPFHSKCDFPGKIKELKVCMDRSVMGRHGILLYPTKKSDKCYLGIMSRIDWEHYDTGFSHADCLYEYDKDCKEHMKEALEIQKSFIKVLKGQGNFKISRPNDKNKIYLMYPTQEALALFKRNKQ